MLFVNVDVQIMGYSKHQIILFLLYMEVSVCKRGRGRDITILQVVVLASRFMSFSHLDLILVCDIMMNFSRMTFTIDNCI